MESCGEAAGRRQKARRASTAKCEATGMMGTCLDLAAASLALLHPHDSLHSLSQVHAALLASLHILGARLELHSDGLEGHVEASILHWAMLCDEESPQCIRRCCVVSWKHVAHGWKADGRLTDCHAQTAAA